jgi:amino acid adenylation domain-containing protein/non-ribosomal peptide synthase protein (TIGR01720 family)
MSEPRIDGFPLSPQQRDLWRLEAPGGPTPYRCRCLVRITGPLEVATLRRAFARVIERHEVLSTELVRLPEMAIPLQRVGEAAEPDLQEVDLRSSSAAEREERVEALWAQGRDWEIGAGRGRLLRAALAALSDREHVLLLVLPALCCDAAGLANLTAEIHAAYAALTGSGEAPAEPLQYIDLAEWQNAIFAAEDGQAGLELWCRQALSLTTGVPLPCERPAAGRFETGSVPVALPGARVGRLAAAAAGHGLDVPDLLLAGWILLLRRHSGQADLPVGLGCDGRNYAELTSALGLFTRFVPLVLPPVDDLALADLLRVLRQTLLEARQWQQCFSWERISPAGSGERRYLPYTFEARGPACSIPGEPSFDIFRREVCTDRFHLCLVCEDGDTGAAARIVYDCGRFAAADVAVLADQLATLLDGFLDRPEEAAGALGLLSASEERELVERRNDTRRELPGEEYVHEIFARWAALTPAAEAVVDEGRCWTYGELEAWANRLAHRLRRLGVGPDATVALCVHRSAATIAALLGVLKAGGAYVPLDPTLPRERLAYMLRDSRPTVLVAHRELLAALPGDLPPTVLLDEAALDEEPATSPADNAGGANLAYVIYTSGSTGRPKGVGVEHRQLRNYALGLLERAPLPPASSWATVSTIAADLGNTSIFGALCSGGCLHVISAERASDPESFGDYVRRHRIDALKLVPSHLKALLQGAAPAAVLPRRQLILGGEPCGWDLAERVRQLAPGCRVINHYGPTETTVGVLAHAVAGERPAAGPASLPLDRPLANSRVYLLGLLAGDLRPVPRWLPGEICIAGAGLARGYLNRPDQTAERFVPDPFGGEPGARLYRTGDLARHLSSGLGLEILGRVDHQVKIRGFRIEPGEIAAVLREHPAVADGLVVARAGASGEKQLVAYVVPRPEAGVDTGDLRRHLAARLPDYMLPAAFVSLPALPLTANGKLDRDALPAPERAQALGFEAPRNAVESLLARAWSAVLRLERVGIHDNFFQLGGDSILSIQVVSRANQEGLRLTPRQLFQHQTIAELAAVAAAPASEAEASLPAPPSGPVPLTPIQRWFFAQELAEPHHFNQSVLLDLRPEVAAAPLAGALALVLAGHDALRLRFRRREGVWEQSHAAGEPVHAARIDLSALAPGRRSAALAAAMNALQASLDLASGPLLRAAIFAAGPGVPLRLAIVIHHLAVDGVSWRILLAELAGICRQLGSGQPVAPSPPPISFQGWAERLAAHAASPALRAELPFWLQAGGTRTRLPVDLPEGGPDVVAAADTVSIALDREETRALLQQVPEVYCTRIDDVLLTAFAQGLARWVGGDPPLIELEGHGREEIFGAIDLSRTVGWLTTRFPVALDLRGVDHPGAALKTVKEQLRRIPQRGIGYGLLRYLSPDPEVNRALAALPVPEISFNYLGRIDAALPESAPFVPSTEPTGLERSPRNRRRYPLDVSVRISGGELRATFTYSRERHRRATLETVARDFLAALQGLIAHCLEPRAGGRTPSDFPLAGLAQSQLDRLVGQGGGLEDVYPLSPLQHGLLFHVLYQPDAGAYFAPLSCTLEGELDAGALRRACQAVIDRHQVLRCSFSWEGLERPLQLVHRRVEVPWEDLDWRELTAAQQEARREALIAAQGRAGFDLSRAPLMRLTLARTGSRSWCFVWARHHLLVDGWTTALLLKEVFGFYDSFAGGQPFQPPASRPYSDYIAWLERRDLAAAEAYWRRALAGFTAPTPLPLLPEAESPAEGEDGAGQEKLLLTAGDFAALEDLAQRQRLTLNTLLQGAWALLLAHYAGAGDVVFGGVVAGRPYDLPGAGSIVGPFINTLPVRVRLPAERPLGEWLRQLQDEQAEQRQHEDSPLVEIHGWSAVPRGLPLFTTILVFESYPRELATGGGGLQARDIRQAVRNSYLLTLRGVPAATLELHLLFDRRHFGATAAAAILGRLEILLRRMAGAAEEPLRAVAEGLAEEDAKRLEEREKDYDQALRERFRSVRRRAVVETGGEP